MNTKVSPLMSGGITALITAILAVGATIGVLSATTITAGTITVGSGTSIDKHVRTTATIDVDSLTFYANTSSAVTLTGAAATDHCSVSVLSGNFSTSSARVSCVAGTDLATLYFNNSASTTFNPGSAVFSIQAWSY